MSARARVGGIDGSDESGSSPLRSRSRSTTESPMEGEEGGESESGGAGSGSGAAADLAPKKHRKRKLVAQLAPVELQRMREVNRVAAKRHRNLSKQKLELQEKHLAAMGDANDQLRIEVKDAALQLATLKRLVLSVYGPGGPRTGQLPFLARC